MSTTTTRIPLADALKEAEAFRALFDGCFERWEFAGSLRRQKPTVGDIEHIIIAKRIPDISKLFDGGGGEICAVKLRVEDLRRSNTLYPHIYTGSNGAPGFRLGDKLMGVDFRDRHHELWLCTPCNWGCILAIRTGSADFSHGLVMRLRKSGFRQMDGYLCCHNPDFAHEHYDRIPCLDEATYFAAAGLDVADWPPEKREALH